MMELSQKADTSELGRSQPAKMNCFLKIVLGDGVTAAPPGFNSSVSPM